MRYVVYDEQSSQLYDRQSSSHRSHSHLENTRSSDEVLGLAARARADVHAVDLDVTAVAGQLAVVGRVGLGHHLWAGGSEVEVLSGLCGE